MRKTLSETLDGKTLQSTHDDRPNNWGTMAGGSRAAVAVYLGDQAELARTAQVFKGYLGDRASYAGFDYGDLSWQADPSKPVGINPKGAMKDGHSIDGAIPDDMRRGGTFHWPPASTGYPWEALQGVMVQAEILGRAGYDTWQWQDQAVLRSVKFLYDIGWKPSGDDQWQPFLIDAHYGTNYASNAGASGGKIMGWTAWTSQADTLPAQNRAPVVSAGADQSILVSAKANLDGTVTDDGLPSGTVTTAWTKVSGPGTVTFGSAAAVDTTAAFSAAGTYVLQLRASDGALSATDSMTVVVGTVAPTNRAPVVSAGADQSILASAKANLDGTVTDDGLPNGTLATAWTKVSGPGTVTFGSAAAVDTTAAFSAAGTYVLQLQANDGALSAADTMTVVVGTVAPTNRAPVVSAGADQSILVSAKANLNGTVTDDGLPSGTLTTAWSKVSGPGTVTFGSAAAVDTTAAFSAAGTYVLRLGANDGQLSAIDEMQVTVAGAGSGTVTTTFQNGVNGYNGADDTRIRSDQPTQLFGSSPKVEIDGNPNFSSLMKWDLSSVPANATVLSATITVNAVNSSQDQFELYQLMRPWVESEANFNQAAAGKAWQVAGASGTSDRSSVVLGAITAPQTGMTTVQLNAAGIAAFQSWIANPQSNNGLIFQDYTDATTDDLDFESSEASTVANRPKLTLVYSVGGTVPQNVAPTVALARIRASSSRPRPISTAR